MRFRNAADAFLTKLGEIAVDGENFEVRGQLTREICHQTVTLDRPLERCIVVPGRRNNVFAAIAETVWVLAGRNDLEFLAPYLPRSSDFSDDGGLTWRAGYGPRLRSWRGSVDQVGQVVRLLSESESSRRAVMSLFDPDQDFQDSNDVPCTNWLHFTVRNGSVDLSVTVRSNDLMWGFSGINTFEWSVLQEMVAFWLNKKVGRVTYFISSLHLYERHFERAAQILSAPTTASPYKVTSATSRFATSFEDLPCRLAQWFDVEERIRTGRMTGTDLGDFEDPLLRDFLAMLKAYWAYRAGKTREAQELLHDVHDSALMAAGASYFAWKSSPSERRGSGIRLSVAPLTTAEFQQYIIRRYRAEQVSREGKKGNDWEMLSSATAVTLAVDRLLLLDPAAPAKRFQRAVDVLLLWMEWQEPLSDILDSAGAGGHMALGGSAEKLEWTIAEYTLRARDDASSESHINSMRESVRSIRREPAEGVGVHEKFDVVEKLSRRACALVAALAKEYPIQVRQLMRDLD